jgi:hypothetical protein
VSLAGGCRCGAVKVTTRAEPITTRACWCKDCQKLAAGGPTYNAFFKSEDVAVEGAVKWHDVLADSGTPLARGFCAECGTPLFSQSHARRHLITVRIGVFGDTDALGPRSVIWTSSAPRWAQIDPDMPHVEGQPPPLA